ncbi:IclR family transcriptional regulator [Leifsonia aquatica]|uniref:IclR family transcriptional regulator n=1 Tax=Leifsonia aquatica TaxID=144185 RepID=UPI00046A23F2|nr:IclR family transcriptional regulator [Leifsonia aquatica]
MTMTRSATSAQQGGAPSIATAFAILDHLASRGEAASMIQIVQNLQLPKSTAFRVLGSLEAVGAVARSGRDKRYSLGSKFTDYARAAPTPSIITRFLTEAGPILRPLDETTQFGVLADTNVTFLACIDSTKPVRLVSYVGRTLPAHASATGKAILAHSPARDVERVLDGGLPALTERTITSADRFLAELEQVRRSGFATEAEESTANLSCLAAPVFGRGDAVVGAITICIPRGAIPADRIGAMKEAVIRARDAMQSGLAA